MTPDPTTEDQGFIRARALGAIWPLIVFPALKLVVHLSTLSGYGIFRDELYYIACSERLAWGYVDHPPLSVALLWLTRTLLGESLSAMRLVPALAGTLTILLVGLIARRLGNRVLPAGGQLVAQILAMTAALLVPTYLGSNHVFSMNAFDQLIWAAVAYVLTGIALRSPRDTASRHKTVDAHGNWLVLGLLLGLGLLNKISVLWLGLGLGVALLLTEHRTMLRRKGPWLAAALAALLFLPHVVWQARHGWPTREFMANATGQKMVGVSPWAFLTSQVDMLGGPVIAGLAWLGLAYLLVAPAARRFRMLGWIYATVFLLLILNGTSRAMYLAPASTWLLAAGAVAGTGLLQRIPAAGWRRCTTAVAFGAVILRAGAAVPFGLPVLPIERYIAYAESLGVAPSTEERKEIGALPQFYADMHGWQAKADAARRIVETLPPADRERACLFAQNYGVAGALEHLGPEDLPPVISGHNNYWLWGPGDCTGEVMIFMGGDADELRTLFEHVEPATTIDCGYCMPYENEQTILIARGPHQPMSESLWASIKHYD